MAQNGSVIIPVLPSAWPKMAFVHFYEQLVDVTFRNKTHFSLIRSIKGASPKIALHF